MAKPVFNPRDYEQHHLAGAAGYVVFFVPLIVNSKSPFCRFCANQGLLTFIAVILLSLFFFIARIVLDWVPALGTLLNWIIQPIGWALRLGVVSVAAYYGWRAYNGDILTFPYVGGIQLIR